MGLPLYFPTDYNRRLAGFGEQKRKKFEIVFQDFGRYGNIDVNFPKSGQSSEPVHTAQRQHRKQGDRSILCASIPTLPLSDIPVEVQNPLQDQVIGQLPHLPSKVTQFQKSLRSLSTAAKSPELSFHSWFMETKRELDERSGSDSDTSDSWDSLDRQMTPALRRLTDLYVDMSQHTSLHGYNPHFSGGILSSVAVDHEEDRGSHLLVHVQGKELDRLVVRCVRPGDPLLTSQALADRQVSQVFQVHTASIQDCVYIITRHADSCSMFAFSDSRLHQLDSYQCGDGAMLTSVCVSPYLPGEGLFCVQGGVVLIWDIRRGVQQTIYKAPRFECRDLWCHAYYASHPRQVVMVDRTAVQMMDSRDGFHKSVDLFALPSRFVNSRECLMNAHHHSKDSPLHVIATSHCLFLVDQRFAGTPVMQWYPDLQGPLQYLASCDWAAEGGVKQGVVLAGSQYPAEVMCYPMSHGGSHSVTMPVNPWRVSKLTDLGEQSSASNSLLVQERLGVSLAGIAVQPGSRLDSLMVYQADCYGEVYFQQYHSPPDPRAASKTGQSLSDSSLPAEVQAHVRSWLQRLEDQVDSRKESLGDCDHKLIRNFRSWLYDAVGENAEDCVDAGGYGNEGLCLLDSVAPPVDSYQADAFTDVHLALLQAEDAPLEMVEKREEWRSLQLKKWKEKNRKRQQEKKQAWEFMPSPLHSPDSPRTSREHEVFNSLEHQQENTLIEEILSSRGKSSMPKTISEDVGDGAALPSDDSASLDDDDDAVDDSADLYDDSGQESTMEQSQHLSQIADDDDDFFSSLDESLIVSFSVSQNTLS